MDEDLLAGADVCIGGVSLSSEPNGFRLLMVSQPAMVAASAMTVSLRLVIRRFLSGDMIDGCSSIVVGACPGASVAIICRVDAAQAAKHVTIPALNRVRRLEYHVALSVILFNKVKNLGVFCSNSHEYWLEYMTKLRILEFPDPRLRKKAAPVDRVDDALRQLIDDMFETMYEAPGIGLAATQVDVHRRLLVADVSAEKDEPEVLINPEILEKDGTTVTEEGCLSVPGYFEEIERAEHIKVRYLDREGNEQEREFEGLLAVCVQHEIDHLDGKLFVDYLSEIKRQRIRKRLDKDRRQHQESAAIL